MERDAKDQQASGLLGPADLGGWFVPVLTPFGGDLEVDEERLSHHIAWLAQQGAEGLVALGSNGEFAALSLPEKLLVLELIGGRATTRWKLAGITTASLAEARILGAAARELGYDAILLLPPYHPRGARPAGRRAFLEQAIAAAGLPCVLYHHPAQTGCPLAELRPLLADHPMVIGVKDSSGDAATAREIRADFPRTRLWLGGDQRVLEGLRSGAVGSITAAANAVPELVRAVYEAFRAGDEAGAERAQSQLDAARALFEGLDMPAVAKLLLELRGWAPCAVRPPSIAVEGEERARIATAFARTAARLSESG